MTTQTSREEVVASPAIGGDPTAYHPHISDEKVDDLERSSSTDLARTDTRVSYQQQIGVTKIESLYMVFGKGWKLVLLWASIGLIGYVWSLAAITTSIYSAFATSSFGKHTVVGLMAVINGIMAAVALPFLAKVCDAASRPAALTVATVLFTVGYVVVAAAPTIYAVVAGEAIFTAGRTGIYQMMHILISDMTQLQWRGLVIACYSLPWIMNGFLAGEITANIRALSATGDGWRWGYGMFTIIVPVAILPSIGVMFWGHHRAKKLGALSLASSTYARRQVLEAVEPPPPRSFLQTLLDAWSAIDGFGLVLFAVGLSLLLAPPTLERIVRDGYKNPSLIAMYTIGGVLFIAFIVWDSFFAKSPVWPRRLMNRTFLTCVTVNALHFFSTGLTSAYYNSWAFIIKPEWTSRNYTYFSNIHTVGLCFFAVFTGILMRFTHRYRYIQIAGLVIRSVGEGINYYAAMHDQRDVTLVWGKILVSCGAGMIVTTTAVAAPASAPHKDLAGAMSVLHMISEISGSVANSISASVWNSQVTQNLAKYLPDISEAERKRIFGNISAARRYLPHDKVNLAYTMAMKPLLAAAIGTTVLALLISIFAQEMVLDRRHNDIEDHKIVRFRNKDEVTEDAILAQVEKAEERARHELACKEA